MLVASVKLMRVRPYGVTRTFPGGTGTSKNSLFLQLRTDVSRTPLQGFDILNPQPREFSPYTLITCILACNRRPSDSRAHRGEEKKGRKNKKITDNPKRNLRRRDMEADWVGEEKAGDGVGRTEALCRRSGDAESVAEYDLPDKVKRAEEEVINPVFDSKRQETARRAAEAMRLLVEGKCNTLCDV